jgi:hypothetical protein
MTKVSGIDLSTIHSVPEIRQDMRDPDANDDQMQRVTLGDEWYNIETGAMFKCIDSSEGSAVWVQVIAPGATRVGAQETRQERQRREGGGQGLDQQRLEQGGEELERSATPRHEVTRPE